MHLKAKIIFAVFALIVVLGACCGLYYWTSVRVDTSTIEYIRSMQKHPNEFLDLAHDINVKSAADIGYVVKGEYHINIHYGDQIIEMNRNCFKDADYRSQLKAIGVAVKSKKKEDGNVIYRVTYWGEPVTEWSLVE